MGASVSSNAATAVSAVSNYVSNSTTADVSEVADIEYNINTNNCYFGGTFDVHTTAQVIQKSRQLVNALQDASVKNTIAQKMLQEATSTVGSMGVGYASATNSASEFATSSSTIINAMSVSVEQSSFSGSTFNCNHSHFVGNVSINFANNISFISDQTLKNTAVQTLVNDISQTVSQKATAHVVGLSGFLIALAILIGAIGYSLSKPLDTKAAKYIIGAALVIGIGVVIILLWLAGASPFFNEDLTCNPFATGDTNGCGDTCTNCCINKKPTTIVLKKHPPLRYAYPMFQLGGGSADFTPGLLEMCIAKAGNSQGSDDGKAGLNGGWNGGTLAGMGSSSAWNEDKTYGAFGVKQLPNPLFLPSTYNGATPTCSSRQYFAIPANHTGISNGIVTPDNIKVIECTANKANSIAITNYNDWRAYCIVSDKNASHARFVCCTYLGIPCDAYIPITVGNKTIPEELSVSSKNAFKFSNFQKPASLFTDAIYGGGNLDGLMGVCNNRIYKLHTFMGKLGWYILIGIVAMILLYIDLKHNYSGPSGKKSK
jgi:hypothetical protein